MKQYIGKIEDEEHAARIYDQQAILNHGPRAKTNFTYTVGELIQLLRKHTDIELSEANKGDDNAGFYM